MSIRTPFNPLGTLGEANRGRTFVQPVMTGPDTWDTSRPYSFGAKVTSPNEMAVAAWHAMDGDDLISASSKNINPLELNIDFEKPCWLDKVRIHAPGTATSGTTVKTIILDGTAYELEGDGNYWYKFIPSKPVKARHITINIATGTWKVYCSKITFTGTF